MGLRAWISEKLRPSSGGERHSPMAFDAGRITRVDPDFVPQAMGPNLRNYRFLKLARLRIQALIDDNPLLCGARELMRRNIVGEAGIEPQPNTGIAELNKKLSAWWWTINEGVDPSREMTLAMSQGEWFNQVFGTGEGMAHVPVVSEFRGYAQGPAIELIDSASRVDLLVSGDYRPTGNRVRQGVEFDNDGRRVAYHVFIKDPYDNDGFAPMIGVPMLGGPNMTRIPAEQAVMGFMRRWMGQVRGVPWPVSVTTTLRLEESFREAEMLLSKAKASVGVWVEGAKGPAMKQKGPGGTDVVRDGYGNPVERMEPGMIGYLPLNAKINMLAASTPGATLDATCVLLQRLEAVGLGIGYGAYSRDRSKSNFSSDRADSLEDRKGYREAQRLLVWHQHTRGFYEAWLTWGVLSGAVKLTQAERDLFDNQPRQFFGVTLIAPGWEYVNPFQEAQADEVALRTGSKSLSMVCANMGKHWQDVIDQRLEEEKYENDKREELGLPPRLVTPPPAKGSTQLDNAEQQQADEAGDGQGGAGGDGGEAEPDPNDPSEPNEPNEPADPKKGGKAQGSSLKAHIRGGRMATLNGRHA